MEWHLLNRFTLLQEEVGANTEYIFALDFRLRGNDEPKIPGHFGSSKRHSGTKGITHQLTFDGMTNATQVREDQTGLGF